MKLALLAVFLVVSAASLAAADDKALKPYVGQVVLSPDPAPASFTELPAFLKANAEKSGHYEFMKWDINFVGVLAKPTDKVTLTVTEAIAKQADAGVAAPLVSIELAVSAQAAGKAAYVVIGHFKPTKAAGFAVNKTYAVALVSGTSIVGKSELVFRE